MAKRKNNSTKPVDVKEEEVKDEEEVLDEDEQEEEEDEDEEDERVSVSYEPEVMEKVVALKKGKVKLEGNESPDLIETLFQEMMESKKSKPTEAEVTPGIPNQLPPKVEIIQLGGKPRNFPVFFIAQVKGGEAMYNERGQRMETAFSEEERRQLHKKLAKINATRRANALPTDYAEIRQ